ncbi:MFS transporter, partial [Vibrio sp. PP-XX7]
AFYLMLKRNTLFIIYTSAFYYSLVGLVGGSINSSSGKTIISWFPDGERGFAMSIRQTAIPLGGSIGTILIPSLAEHYSFSSSFFFYQGLVL